MDELLKNFGNIVFEARNREGFTQQEVGEAIGVDSRTILEIEHGQRNPTFKNVYHLIRYLNIDPSEVFCPGQTKPSSSHKQLHQMIDICSEHEASSLLIIDRDILDALRSPKKENIK